MKEIYVRLLSVCAVFAALVAASCSGGDLPAAPTPPPAASTPPPPPPVFVTAHLRGRVLEEGEVPVAGATVKATGNPGSAITDASGAFDIALSINLQSRPLGFVYVYIDKPGYERSLSGASFASFGSPSGIADVSQDYRLYRIRTIAAGAATRLAVASEDPWCGIEAEWSCRIIRIKSLQAGTLIVEAIPHHASTHFGLVLSNAYQYPFTLTPRLSIPVIAGQETPVDLLLRFDWANGKPSGPAQGVTLATSLLSGQ